MYLDAIYFLRRSRFSSDAGVDFLTLCVSLRSHLLLQAWASYSEWTGQK